MVLKNLLSIIRLEELNESVHKSIVINEEQLRVDVDSNLQEKLSQNETGRGRSRDVKLKKPEPWSSKAAKAIEKETFNQSAASAMSSASVSITSSVLRDTKKKKIKAKSKFKRPPRYPRDSSPFHYSPPKAQPRERSVRYRKL